MASSTALPKYIYKILPASLAPPNPLPFALPVSDLDARDNYIHASTSAQLLNTLRRFFQSDVSIILLRIPVANVQDVIVWEDPSNMPPKGTPWTAESGVALPSHFFPHLYNGLKVGRNEVDAAGVWERKGDAWSTAGWPFNEDDIPMNC